MRSVRLPLPTIALNLEFVWRIEFILMHIVDCLIIVFHPMSALSRFAASQRPSLFKTEIAYCHIILKVFSVKTTILDQGIGRSTFEISWNNSITQ